MSKLLMRMMGINEVYALLRLQVYYLLRPQEGHSDHDLVVFDMPALEYADDGSWVRGYKRGPRHSMSQEITAFRV